MTYIKWKDEVESYLGNLSASEKQKVFSYFAEMYADKRDAGISEERIIEGFGAPYDVAQRILADSKEASSANTDNQQGAVHGTGGNNYNYNYYNYNYGGAPAGFNASGEAQPARGESYYGGNGGNNNRTNPADVDVSDIDMPLPEGTPKKKEKGNGGSAFVSVILMIVLAIPTFVLLCTAISLTVGFFAAAIGCIVSGCMTMGEAVGGLVANYSRDFIGLLGSGFLQFGIGLLFIPLSILVTKLVWKLVRWVYRQLKNVVTA